MSDRGIYRDESRIRHMCNALEKVVEKSRGVHRDDLIEGEDNTELIIHYLTILGEASNNVSAEFAGKHPEIDFKAMADTSLAETTRERAAMERACASMCVPMIARKRSGAGCI